ncbi:MAG TPA: hypothetical protein VJ951_12360 [Bacteroidales bacterium]|nr:hypothetical protein [Bacteroidales bacterium]
MKRSRYDRFLIGFIPGVIIPGITFIVTWMLMSHLSLGEYISRFYDYNKLPHLISLSAIPNLLVFFIFIWTDNYRSAKGVISATFLLTFIMLIIKFF